VPALHIGQQANKLLALPNCSGEVMATFSRCTYLKGPEDEILWLADPSLPAHRRSIQVHLPQNLLTTGMSFRLQGAKLVIGDRMMVDMEPACELRFPQPDPKQVLPIPEVVHRSRRVTRILGTSKEADGLGQLILLLGNDRYKVSRPPSDTFLNRALGPIRRIVEACIRCDFNRIALESLPLIGYGPGLTPSGDDFLGGLLFTSTWLRLAYPGQFDWDVQWTERIVSTARFQTNRISHALMKDLAHGHGPQPLHTFLLALLMDVNFEDLVEVVQPLLEIGHSSGWDLLAGVLTGMLLLHEKSSLSAACLRLLFRRNTLSFSREGT